MSDEKKDSKLSSDDLNKQILGAIAKPYKGESTSRWIKNMDDEALVDEITKATPSQSLNLTSPVLLDRLFDEFQRYAYEYQNSATTGPRISVNVGRPAGSDSPASAQYGQVPVLCRGHISTNRWALIFLGFVGKVQAFVVPVEYTVGFHPSQKEFKPFVELKSVLERGGTDWRIDGYSISSEMLPPLAKRFFGSLIKVEREEAKHTDQFVMDPTIPIEAPAAPPRMEENEGVELLSDSLLQQEDLRKKQFQQANQQAQYQSLGAPSAPRQSASQQQPRYQSSPEIPKLAGDGESDTIPEAFERNHQMVQAALGDFFARMDIEVDRLTKIGMMSIQAQDMVGAQRTIIRSAKLKDMRERVNDLSNEWNAVVQE